MRARRRWGLCLALAGVMGCEDPGVPGATEAGVEAGPALDGGDGPAQDGAADLAGEDAQIELDGAGGERQDRGRPDGGRPDGAQPDGGRPDGAQPDGSRLDGAPEDAGPPDAAAPVCAPGALRRCGTATGQCSFGRRICDPAGQWGPCEGAVGPVAERCNGLDDDCDGVVDERVERPCDPGGGACRAGRQRCEAGVFGACAPWPGDQTETCNGVDDDCDGLIDEGLQRPCGRDVGACRAGSARCVQGQWLACEDAVEPTEERCNDQDDDCDGVVDEELFEPCDAPAGICQGGVRICRAGLYGPCEGAAAGLPEICNNLDDDCDGAVDEALARPCGEALGACLPGAQRCEAGVWRPCAGGQGPQAERCNGLDDDCDGAVDEGLVPVACGVSAGGCLPGVRRCQGGALGPCEGAVAAAPELCNGGDDDCDGVVDEGLAPEPCGGELGLCTPGVRACAEGAWQPCTGVEPAVDVCNLLDDDCDGLVDEDFPEDRDQDGINDCAEQRFGFDPEDPGDALADFNHDGIDNLSTLRAGGDPWSMVYFYPLPGAAPGERRVSVRLHAPEPDTRPVILELYVALEGAELQRMHPGLAPLLASKTVDLFLFSPGVYRAVVVAPNLEQVSTGELFEMVISAPAGGEVARIRLDRERSAFAPGDADAALQARTVSHRVDLEVR